MTTKISLPCICTTLKNGETRFLLDHNKNILFCSTINIKSFDVERIIDNFNNNKKQDKYFNTFDYPNNCKGKDIQSFNPSSENFLPEIIINDETSKKYYSSDVNINMFEKSLTFNTYFSSNQKTTQMELYNKLNINDKKKFAISLHYMDLSENLINQFNKLQNEININSVNKPINYNENDYVQKYYSDNKKVIKDIIDRIINFRISVLEVEIIKVAEPTKGLSKVVIAIISLVCVVIFITCIAIGIGIYQHRQKQIKAAASAAVTATAAIATATSTISATKPVGYGHA